MDIVVRISNEDRIPIYVQIANQLKAMIATGELKKGDPLLGREVLAKRLGVNINTVNHAYRILENEGFIYSKQGIGSFVNPQIERKSKTELFDEIRNQLLELRRRALTYGLSDQEFMSLVRESLETGWEPSIPRAAFIECHEAWTNPLADRLQEELRIEVNPVVISDQKADLKEWIQSIRGAEIIITTHAHFNDVRKIVGADKWIFPLDLHLSYETMNELARIKDARIAVPFLRPATVRRLDHSIKAVGFNIDLVPVQHRDTENLRRRIEAFKTVMVPPNHLPEIKQVIHGNVKVIPINTVLSEESVQHLKQNVSTIYPGLQSPVLKRRAESSAPLARKEAPP